MTETLYKYRTLDNFQNVVDILINNRLYAAKYKDLNDPMEGQYYYRNGRLYNDIRDKLLEEKEELRICSLSKSKDNLLMWSHYAKGDRGVAIGLKINDNDYKVKPIKYNGFPCIYNQNYNNLSAINILSHKLEVWDYEEEVRVFVNNQQFINISIIEVIMGSRMDDSDKSLVRNLINKINPTINIINAR